MERSDGDPEPGALLVLAPAGLVHVHDALAANRDRRLLDRRGERTGNVLLNRADRPE